MVKSLKIRKKKMADKYVFLSINDNLTFCETYVSRKILAKLAHFATLKYRIFTSN